MTTTLGTDANNDLYIAKDGRLAVLTGVDAVQQACEQAVKAILGEMVFSADTGMPDFQLIWDGNPNIGQYEAYLRQTILSVDGVEAITTLQISVQGDILMYTATIQTIYGGATLNG